MSEIDSRTAPSRGRSSTRGGRGGYSRGGPRGAHRSTNGTSKDVQIEEPLDEQGELGDMKKKYSAELIMIRDVFPDWSDFDLVFALEEASGDIEATIERIAAGNVSQFSDVKKPKDRSRSKVKETPATAGADQFTAPARGGRGRGGFEGTRGGRGRGGADRGRGGFRGARGGHATADATTKDTTTVSVPTTESTAWDTPASAETKPTTNAWDTGAPAATTSNPPPARETPAPTTAEKSKDQGAWGTAAPAAAAPAAAVAADSTPAASSEATKSAAPDSGAKKTWASMFAKPKPPPVPVVPKTVPAPKPAAETAKAEEAPVAQQPAPPAEAVQQPDAQATAPVAEQAAEPAPSAQIETPALAVDAVEAPPSRPAEAQDTSSLTPSKVPLTEDNLENLPDSSHPPATLTAASTAGTVESRVITPQLPIGRPPTGGFQTSAYRAAATPARSASYQRRVLEQQQAVVMPGHNAVDRAAVQFGSLGLNGDAVNLDVDEEREEAETRTQPQQSPPSQPRASLPPAPRQNALSQEQSAQESLPTPRQAPGLPPPGQHSFPQQDTSLSSLPQDGAQSGQYSQYGRYGQQPDSTAQAQKPFDPFSHQAPSSAFDQYASQPSAQQQQQQGFGAFSSAPSDYSHYYTADQQRNAYQNYYGAAYGQQTTQSQDGASVQQRSSSGFGSAPGDSAFSSAQAPAQSQSRYGDAQGSGHNTPNPSMSSQPQTAAPAQHQQPQHQTAYPGYPYGHPYYNSPYHAAYQNQFGFNGQVGYGAPFGGKGQMYGQPHGYGMNPPSTYESSPATAGSFGQSSMVSRDSALGSGLGDYARSSAQPTQLSSGSFGGVSEPFGRAQSGFQGQAQGYGQQQSTGTSDELKPFGESKTGGPSPALGQPGRPESATNSVGGQSAPSSALPPPQSHQQGFSGYPGFSSQGSQYGLGGLGGSGHQQGAYGGYSGFGNSYGNAYGRGGWGGNYGH